MRLAPIQLFFLIAAVLVAGARATDAVDDGTAIREALATYNRLAAWPLPMPDDDALREIATGEAVNVRERTAMDQVDGQRQDRIRIVGYRLVRRPRLLVWLATLDIGTQHSQRVTEHLVGSDDAGGSLWYQHLNTPWPVRDRHWLIRNGKGLDVARRSNDTIWEHRWQLEDGGEAMAQRLLSDGEVAGLDQRDGRRALYLTVNRGAWTMIALDEDSTLVAAHTAADMGGWIPESWVAAFVSRNLHRVLNELDRRADGIHERYTGGYPVFTGDGRPITPAMARAAKRNHERR